MPLCARIVAVADVYDALTSVRPYKSALDEPACVRYVRTRSGKHFDPRIVEAFLGARKEVISRSSTNGLMAEPNVAAPAAAGPSRACASD